VLAGENLLGIDPLQFDGSDAELKGQIATLRREMGEAKVPLALEHIERVLSGGTDKLVVFAWHKSVIQGLAEAPSLSKYNPVTVMGGATDGQKHERKRQFIEDPDCKLFVGNIMACGTGVDGLQQVCNTAVFAEASWVPGDNDQAVDRLWRMGQGTNVLAQFLVAPESMDERVLGSAINKAENTHAALDAKWEV
jgi:SWI/SNF-related matrix-associated actin-dependent regulator 1 of chromatin subfamily A